MPAPKSYRPPIEPVDVPPDLPERPDRPEPEVDQLLEQHDDDLDSRVPGQAYTRKQKQAQNARAKAKLKGKIELARMQVPGYKPVAVPQAKESISRRVDTIRDKIAYSANKIADELASAVSTPNKKDKEYIKGIVWSLGVLYDKLCTGQTEAVTVRIPSKLLENVKAVIAIQADKRNNKPTEPKDVTPPSALDI